MRNAQAERKGIFEALECRTLLSASTGLIDVQLTQSAIEAQTGGAATGLGGDVWNEINVLGYGSNPNNSFLNSPTIPNAGGAPIVLNNTSGLDTGVTLNIASDDTGVDGSLGVTGTSNSPFRFGQDGPVMEHGLAAGAGVSVTFGGLPVGARYNVVLLSENGADDTERTSTQFTVAGESQTVSDPGIAPFFELGINYAEFNDAAVDASGQLTIHFQGSSLPGILNGIQLQPAVHISFDSLASPFAAGTPENIGISVSRPDGDSTTDPVTTAFSVDGSEPLTHSGATPDDYVVPLALTNAGEYRMSVTDALDGIVVGGAFDVVPGSASQLVFFQQPTDVAVNTSITPNVAVGVEDDFGNLIVDDDSTIQLDVFSGPGQLNPVGIGGPITADVQSGIATFNSVSLDTPGTAYVLTASDAADNLGLPFTPNAFNSQPFNVTAPGTGELFDFEFGSGQTDQPQSGAAALGSPTDGDWNVADAFTTQIDLSTNAGNVTAFDTTGVDSIAVAYSANYAAGQSSSTPLLESELVAAPDADGVLTLSGLDAAAAYNLVLYSYDPGTQSSVTIGGAAPQTFGSFQEGAYEQFDNLAPDATDGSITVNFLGAINGFQLQKAGGSSGAVATSIGFVLPQPYSITVDQPITSPGDPAGELDLLIFDQDGNLDTSDTSSVTLSVFDGNNNFVESTSSNFAGGAASFFGLSIPAAGTYTLLANDSSPNVSPTFGTVEVTPATPNITWATPDAIPFGTPISAAQLDATADVQGTFEYFTPGATGREPVFASEVLPVGVTTLTAEFTPTDTARFTTASSSVPLTVVPADTAVGLSGTTTTYGDLNGALRATVSSATGAPVTGNGYVAFEFPDLGIIQDEEVSNDVAEFATTALPAGVHYVLATYHDTGGMFNNSATASADVTVQPAQTFLSVGGPLVYLFGQDVSFQASIGGIPDGVTLPDATITYTLLDHSMTPVAGTPTTVSADAGPTGMASIDLGDSLPVDTYTLKASLAPGNPNFAVSDTFIAPFAVHPAVPTVAVTDDGGAYDGSSRPAFATVNGASTLEGVGITLTYVPGTYDVDGITAFLDAGGVGSDVAPAEPGDYTVLASYAGSPPHYTSADAVANFTITRAASALTLTGGTFDYGDSIPADPTVSASIASTPGATGTVTFSLDDDPNLSDDFLSNYLGVSGGSGGPVSSTVALTAADGGGSAASWAVDLDDAATAAFGTYAGYHIPLEPGTYYIRADYSGDARHAASTSDVEKIVIDAVTPDVSVPDVTTVVGANAVITATASSHGIPVTNFSGTMHDRVEFSVYADSSNVAIASGSALVAADGTATVDLNSLAQTLDQPDRRFPTGTYQIRSAFVSTDVGYNSSVDPTISTLVINLPSPTLTLSAPGGVYNGLPFVANALIDGATSLHDLDANDNPADFAPTLAYYAGTFSDPSQLAGVVGTAQAPTDAGSYTVLASFGGSLHYAPSSAIANFQITLAPLTLTVNNTSRPFGSDNPEFSLNAEGFAPGESLANLDGTPSFTTSASPSSPIGDYAVSVSGLSSNNYAITYVPGELSITQASANIALSTAVPDFTYNGHPDELPSATVTGADGAALTDHPLTYAYFKPGSLPGQLEALASAPVNAGTYVFQVTYAGDANYAATTLSVNFTIAQAPLTVTADDQTVAFGSPIPQLTAHYDGFVNGESRAVLKTPAQLGVPFDVTNAGNYPIAVGGATADNYAITFVPGRLTINPFTPAIVLPTANFAYDGAPHAPTATVTGVNGAALSPVVYTYFNGASADPMHGRGDVPTKPGTYTVTAVYNGTQNYASVSATTTYTIVTRDVTGQFKVATTKTTLNVAGKTFTEVLTITNTGTAIAGPLSMVVSGLQTGIKLNGATGTDGSGNAYVEFAPTGMAAGQTITLTLVFTDPTLATPKASLQMLAGLGV